MNCDRINELYGGKIFSKETQDAARERIHWICSRVRGKRVLDIGCSQGITCLLLGREGFHCIGVDVEQPAVDYALDALAREDAPVRERIEFRIEDATCLSFPDGSFDSVILGEVLEHLTHPEKVLREAARVLKENGTSIITVPFGLNDHPDHKRTYYPVSFLEAVAPYFRTEYLDSLNENIVYCGVKNGSDKTRRISREEQLAEKLRLLVLTEERFLLKERHCLERLIQLNQQVKELGKGTSDLTAANENLRAELAKVARKQEAELRERELARLQELAGKEAELKELAEGYGKALEKKEAELRDLESGYRGELEKKETELRELVREHRDELAARDTELKVLAASKLKKAESLHNEHEQRLLDLESRHREELEKKEAELRELVREHRDELAARDAELKMLAASKLKDAESLHNEHEQRLLDLESRHREELARMEKELVLLDSSRIREVEILRREYGEKLRLELAVQADQFRKACRWRIGSLFVEPWAMAARLLRGRFRSIPDQGESPRPDSGAASAVVSKRVPAGRKDPVPEPRLDTAGEKVPADGSGQLTIGCICDEFTAACFKPEWRMITFRPDNWRETLEREEPRAVFVESAWRGNGGSWQYRIASYERDMGDELPELLAWTGEKGIPSIFWNKEDPPHYERFIRKAGLFDHIFTSDADCVPRYRKELGHNRVYPLPFAAQPLIHNPVLEQSREHNVSFAGTYYGGSYEERQKDMDILLKPALDFDLHIFDRQHGVTGPGSEQFRFPDIYQSAIRGRLEYQEMIRAYKRYRVFLNVNSIKTSPTMFSRRVFELLASGTPVISTHSIGIEKILGTDLVLFSESEDDTRRHLERLLGDEDYWSRLSVRGIRKVLEEHTYENRAGEIFAKTGLGPAGVKQPSFAVFSVVQDAAALASLGESLARQSYPHFSVVLVLDRALPRNIETEFRNALAGRSIEAVPGENETALREVMARHSASHVAVFEARDYYGPNYLRDYALSLKYSGGRYLGKSTCYTLGGEGLVLRNPGFEFRLVSEVPLATFAAVRNVVDPGYLPTLLRRKTFNSLSREGIISLDRFNYVERGDRSNQDAVILDSIGI